jgi:hypothetical protein
MASTDSRVHQQLFVSEANSGAEEKAAKEV